MYSEEQKERALRTYHHLGSATATVRRLGYPSRESMYEWIRNEGKANGRRKKLNLINTIEHPRIRSRYPKRDNQRIKKSPPT